GEQDQTVGEGGVGRAEHAIERERDAVGAARLLDAPVYLPGVAAKLAPVVGRAIHAFRRQVRFQDKWPPAHAHWPVRAHGTGEIETDEAEKAPRAGEIGDEIDLDRHGLRGILAHACLLGSGWISRLRARGART